MQAVRVRLAVVETVRAVLIVVAVALACALVMGLVWCVVDFLRSYGTGVKLFPFLEPTTGGEQPIRLYPAGTAYGAIEDLLQSYNAVCRGAARFGTGMGLIGGAFLGLSMVRTPSGFAHYFATLVCGALVGGRLFIMLSSSPRLLLMGATIGAIVLVLMTFITRREQLKPLPDL